jgi:2-polyprenyl-3-methyl-5-hydroxy-6-metoxy-1,4-benzoquinol methylase
VPTAAQDRDERYLAGAQLFSGNPNGVLVAEATEMPPGRALDVGCGEGADARWLASHGWGVTAVDVSGVALERAAQAAAAEGPAVADRIRWVRSRPTSRGSSTTAGR